MIQKPTPPTTIDEYISQCAKEVQPYLTQIRELVLSECPDAEEKISYQIPTFQYYYGLVGFGETKNGFSFYTMNPELVKILSPTWEGISYKGSTLHFKPGKELPEEVLRDIVRRRMIENKERALAKKKR